MVRLLSTINLSYFLLDPSMQELIRNRRLSPGELRRVHDNVNDLVNTRIKAMRSIMLFVLVLFLLFIVVAVQQGEGPQMMMVSLLSTMAIVFGVLALMRFALIPAPERQFARCLAQGYPELTSELGKDSFAKPAWDPMRRGRKAKTQGPLTDYATQKEESVQGKAARRRRNIATAWQSVVVIVVVAVAAVVLAGGMDFLYAGIGGFYVRLALFPVVTCCVVAYWLVKRKRYKQLTKGAVATGIFFMAIALVFGASLYADIPSLASSSSTTPTHVSDRSTWRGTTELSGQASGSSRRESFTVSRGMDRVWEYEQESGEQQDVVCTVTYLPHSRYVLDVAYSTANTSAVYQDIDIERALENPIASQSETGR